MNELKPFVNEEFGYIRVMTVDDEPWMVGRDVATALGYAKPQKAIADHVDEDDALKRGIMDSMGRLQETILINESGLYSLVFASKLPQAKQFRRWVTSEVLPSIRRTGRYHRVPEDKATDYDAYIKLAELVKACPKNKRKELLNSLSEAAARKHPYYQSEEYQKSKVELTEEERLAQRRIYDRAYRAAHRDEINARKSAWRKMRKEQGYPKT